MYEILGVVDVVGVVEDITPSITGTYATTRLLHVQRVRVVALRRLSKTVKAVLWPINARALRHARYFCDASQAP